MMPDRDDEIARSLSRLHRLIATVVGTIIGKGQGESKGYQVWTPGGAAQMRPSGPRGNQRAIRGSGDGRAAYGGMASRPG